MAKIMHGQISKFFLKSLILLLAIGLFNFGDKVFAQTVDSTDYVPSDTYEKVMDKLFPRGSKRDFTDGREFAMSLRFASEEAQINIVKLNNGEISITTYELPTNAPSIYKQIKLLLEKDRSASVETLASKIEVKMQSVRATPKVKKIINRFALLRLSPQFEAGILLDATEYDFDYKTFANEVRFRLQSKKQKSDRSEYPLIKWMNEMKEIVFTLED